MWRASKWVTALSMIALAGMLLAPAQTAGTGPQDVTAQPKGTLPSSPPPPPCPLTTVAKGFHSRLGFDHPDFMGADFVIRDPGAWTAFWAAHAPENVPPPPINFEHDVVLATIQGPQPTGGGPNIAIVDLQVPGPFAQVVIVDDERPGPEDQVTNPFHVVTICKELLPPWRSVSFQHLRPFPESGVVVGRIFAAPPQGDPVPLPGADVTLTNPGGVRHAMSGLDGSYFFVNVGPGEYMLHAEHPGFQPAEAPLVVPPHKLVARDLVLTPLPPEDGVIRGHVLGARPDGDPLPLPQALVQIFHGNMEIAHRLTDQQGFFIFEHVPPGEYLVRASHPGFQPQEFMAVVEPGGVVEHVFVLQPAPPPGTFVGKVLGALDNQHQVPIPGALVRLFGPDGNVVRETHTDWHGLFCMPDVPPGPYLARADKDGWLPDEAQVEIHPGEPTFHMFLLHKP